MSKRSSLVWKLLAPVAVLTAAAIPACTSTSDGDDTGTGGTASGTGGTGASSTSTAVASGGSTAAAGTGTSATGGTTSLPVGNACGTVAEALITDFTYDETADPLPDAETVSFGDWTENLSGSPFVWFNDPSTLTSDILEDAWHLTGTMSNYAGLNPGFMASGDVCNLIDAGDYSGITFKIWKNGSTATSVTLTMTVSTAADDISDAWLTANGQTVTTASYGYCTPTLDPTDPEATQYSQQDCASPTTTVTIPDDAIDAASAYTVELAWTDFTGGKPAANPTPSEITAILWNLQWEYLWTEEGGGTPAEHAYTFDFYIDDLAFLP